MNTYLIDILRILKEQSDENHRLSQQEILDLMRKKHPGIDRKAIRRNLDKLIDLGYEIECDESTRKGKNGEETPVCTEWYINKDFTDAELHFLIDWLLCTKYISKSNRKELIEKLKKHASKSFRQKFNSPQNDPENHELLLTIEIINEAIDKGRRVSFQFATHSTGKELQYKLNKDGSRHEYRVSPYEIVVQNARYYLICSHSKGDLFHYRLDCIRNAKIIENQKIRPIGDIKGYNGDWDLPEYMRGRVYMYGGKSERVTFHAYKKINPGIGFHIIDWFGKDNVVFSNETEDTVEASVTVVPQSMLCWALQFGPSVEILNPKSLRNEVRDAVKTMWERYKDEENEDKGKEERGPNERETDKK